MPLSRDGRLVLRIPAWPPRRREKGGAPAPAPVEDSRPRSVDPVEPPRRPAPPAPPPPPPPPPRPLEPEPAFVRPVESLVVAPTLVVPKVERVEPPPYPRASGPRIEAGGRPALVVVDASNHRVQILGTDGGLIASFGQKGNAPAQFENPQKAAVDARRGYIYVSDFNNFRVQKFTLRGEFLDVVGRSGTGDGEFNYPQGIAVDDRSNLRGRRLQRPHPGLDEFLRLRAQVRRGRPRADGQGALETPRRSRSPATARSTSPSRRTTAS
jgi:hypothetical protein